jgi:ubiquinone/menaquinone biosynthesis C-methylase UbiE
VTTYDGIIARVIPSAEFHQNRYARELEARVRPGSRWLDVGAGSRLHRGWMGSAPDVLAARAAWVIGCDLEPQGLAANPVLTAAVVADATRLPHPDGSFDLVTANMVLEHLPHGEPMFTEVARVLAPGGQFAFVTPHLGHPAVRLMSMIPRRTRRAVAQMTDKRASADIFPTHYAVNTPEAVRRCAAVAGLRVDSLEVFFSYPVFRAPTAAVWLEAIWIRAMMRPGLRRRMGSNLVGVLRKD